MAVELVRQVWCDACLREAGLQIPATWSQVVTIGSVSREVDLCTDHRMVFIDPLAEVLEVASPPELPEKDRVPCPLCDRTYQDRKGLRWHFTKDHPGAEIPPLQNDGRGRTRDKAQACPVCGRICNGGLGVVSHMRFKHPEVPAEARLARPIKPRKHNQPKVDGSLRTRVGDGV